MNAIYKKIIIGVFCLAMCSLSFTTTDATGDGLKPNLEGTWRLISYKYGKDDSFSKVPPFMEYRKMLTKNHFTWVSYGENGDDVIGAGGGTYQVKGNKYTETSDFFHPAGTVPPGTSTDFEFDLSGNTWKISGVIKSVKIDPKTGKTDKIEEIKLAEVWERVR